MLYQVVSLTLRSIMANQKKTPEPPRRKATFNTSWHVQDRRSEEARRQKHFSVAIGWWAAGPDFV